MPELGLLADDFPEPFLKVFDLRGGATATVAPGVEVPLDPFLGTMGVATDEPGQHSPFPPHRGGGNVDCRHLVVGSTLWLPIWCEGALFSCGDAHGAQGDGEVCVSAIECAMEATLRFRLHKRSIAGPAFRVPRAVGDPGPHYGTMGIDSDLMEGARTAVRNMIEWLVAEHGLTREDAYVLCSLGGRPEDPRDRRRRRLERRDGDAAQRLRIKPASVARAPLAGVMDQDRRGGGDGFVLEDVHPGICQESHRLERAERDRLLVLGLERERVEHLLELGGVLDVELRVEQELPEAVGRETRPLHQLLDVVRLRVVRLEPDHPQDRDGVVVPDPDVLVADQLGESRRDRARTEGVDVDAERSEVADSGFPRVRVWPNLSVFTRRGVQRRPRASREA